MRDAIEDVLLAAPPLRRLAWRAGRRLYCAARGEPRENAIATNGEAHLQRRVLAALPPKTTPVVCDVGACVGDWSLSLLEALGAAGRARARVFAFEPIPTTRVRFEAALARHPLGGLVEAQTCAVSDSRGRSRIAVMGEMGGTDTLSPGADTPPGGWIDVETTDLASWVARQGLERLHLVKVDAEGHDLFVLRGALPLLREERIDVLQFEYNHRWVFARAFLKDVFDLAAQLPYALARITPAGVELLPEWHPELERFFEANYCLIRRPALDWFSCRRGRFDAANTYA